MKHFFFWTVLYPILALLWFLRTGLTPFGQPQIFVAAFMVWGILWFVTVFNGPKYLKFAFVGLLALTAFKQWFPGTTAGAEVRAQHLDKKNYERARTATQEIPTEIICDKEVVQQKRITFFATNGIDSKKLSQIFVSERDGRLLCFDQPGVDPLNGDSLRAVTKSDVARIAQQEPLRVASAPTPPPLTAEDVRAIARQTIDAIATPPPPVTTAPANMAPANPTPETSPQEPQPSPAQQPMAAQPRSGPNDWTPPPRREVLRFPMPGDTLDSMLGRRPPKKRDRKETER